MPTDPGTHEEPMTRFPKRSNSEPESHRTMVPESLAHDVCLEVDGSFGNPALYGYK